MGQRLKSLVIFVIAALVSGVAGTAFANDDGGNSLTLSIWPGYLPADIPEQFQAATGIALEIIERPSSRELKAGDLAALDLVALSGPSAQALAAEDAFATLDHGLIPNLKHLYPAARDLALDRGNQFSIPLTWGTTGICYRSDLVTEAPTRWVDILRPAKEVADKVTLLDSPRWLLAAQFKDLGLSVNETAPDKIKEAAKKLIETRPHRFDSTAFFVRLGSGDVVMAHAWDSWCNHAARNNEAIKFALPKEGSDLWVDVLAIPKDAKNKSGAHAFMDFILRPEIAKQITEYSLYNSPNKAGMAAVDRATIAKYPGFAVKAEELAKQEVMLDVGKTASDYTRAAVDVVNAR